jgi:hypothetical protein
MNNFFFCLFLFISHSLLAQAPSEDLPWRDISLIKVHAKRPFVPTGGSLGEYFESKVFGQEILDQPGLLSEKEYLEVFANQNLSKKDYLEYRNQYWQRLLSFFVLARMFEGEAFQNPLWHQMPSEVGDYAAIYSLLWYAEQILKIDMSKPLPSYESIYARMKSEASDGIRLRIDWRWCKYGTKAICQSLARKFPAFTDQIIDIDTLPATWGEFNALVVTRITPYFVSEGRRWAMQSLLNSEAQKYLNISVSQKDKQKRMIYHQIVDDCKRESNSQTNSQSDESKSLCELVAKETFGSEKIQSLLEKFWTSKQESAAWQDVLKNLAQKYTIYETTNLCELAKNDDRFFCNQVNLSDIEGLSKDSLFWILSLGSGP